MFWIKKCRAFFAAFFSCASPLLLFSISPTMSEVYAYVRARSLSSLSLFVQKGCEGIGARRREQEKKNTYARGTTTSRLLRAECKANGCTTCACTFFTLSFGGLPRNFFLDSISRLPRDRIVETARALFRVSCHENEGAGCGATTVRLRHVANERSRVRRRTKNESIFVREQHCFPAEPSPRMPHAERILISNATRELPVTFFYIAP